ncbi:aa3-type cytochrome c oxidase subunit IV [Sphingomonas sp. RS6]
MAETGDNAADMKAHLQTWHGFTGLMKWGSVAVFLIVGFVVFLIAG